MKNFTSRMASLLLLCGALFTSTTAKAETANAVVKMTYVDGSNADTSYGVIATGETARAGYNNAPGSSVGFANTGWGCNWITYIEVDASAIDGTITGASLTADVSGSTDNKRATGWGVGYNSSDWSADMTYNTADKSITTLGAVLWTTTKNSAVFETKSWDITNSLKGDADKKTTILVYETAAAGGYIKNPVVSITYTPAGADVADYTVKFVADGVEIKDASLRHDALVGSPTSIEEDDKATFYNEDGSLKYVYNSDDASSVSIAKDGSSVITVTFDAYGKYTYTLNAVYGTSNLKELATAELYEDETSVVYYPLALQKDGKWYTTKQNAVQPYYGVTVTKDDATKAIEYDLNADVDYFFEGNELTIAEGNWATVTGAPNMMSSGDASRMAPNSKVYTPELAAGTYQMTIVARNQRAKAGETETVTLLIRSSEGEFTPSALEIPTWQSAGGFGANVVNDIVIAEGESLALGNLTEYNSNIEIDYIILKNQDTQKVAFKLGNATDSYASFVPARDADFEASGVKAYIVTEITEDEVVMREVKTAKAGTPVLLKGTKDDVVTIQVAEAAADAEGNLLKAATGEGVGSAYVLSYVDDEWAFRSYTGETLSAGKVYLAVPTEVKAEALGLQIGTATAIKTLAAPAAKGAIYTIAGQRVSSMKKAGLYIAGGKKVAVK